MWLSANISLCAVEAAAGLHGPQGEDRKVAAVLDASGREMEGWAVRQFGDVYYDHGYAYMSLMLSREQQGQTTDGVQLVAIRLADGQVTELTDVMEGMKRWNLHLSRRQMWCTPCGEIGGCSSGGLPCGRTLPAGERAGGGLV